MLDLYIIVLYMLAMVIIGFIFMRFNKGASDYFKGGNRIPWLVAGLSCFMSSFSAWTFTGAAGVAYHDGIVVVFLYLGNAVTFCATLAPHPHYHHHGLPGGALR